MITTEDVIMDNGFDGNNQGFQENGGVSGGETERTEKTPIRIRAAFTALSRHIIRISRISRISRTSRTSRIRHRTVRGRIPGTDRIPGISSITVRIPGTDRADISRIISTDIPAAGTVSPTAVSISTRSR